MYFICTLLNYQVGMWFVMYKYAKQSHAKHGNAYPCMECCCGMSPLVVLLVCTKVRYAETSSIALSPQGSLARAMCQYFHLVT